MPERGSSSKHSSTLLQFEIVPATDDHHIVVRSFDLGCLAIADCECRRERQGELGSRGSDHQALRPFHQEEEPQERELGESLSVIWVPISGLFAGAAVISRCPAQTERCRSGRSGRSRKPLSLLRGTEGSNPSLSASAPFAIIRTHPQNGVDYNVLWGIIPCSVRRTSQPNGYRDGDESMGTRIGTERLPH